MILIAIAHSGCTAPHSKASFCAAVLVSSLAVSLENMFKEVS